MHYLPQSKYTFDEICKQCSDAINRRPDVNEDRTDLYSEVRKFYHYADTLTAAR